MKKIHILLPILVAFSGVALAQADAPRADKTEDLTGIQRLLAKQDIGGDSPAAAKPLAVDAAAKSKQAAVPVASAAARHPDAADLAVPSVSEPAAKAAATPPATPQVATAQVAPPVAEPSPIMDFPLLQPDMATAPRKSRALSPSERMYLKREETLIQQIRLLELQARAAELKKTIDGISMGAGRASVAPDSVSLSMPEAISAPTLGLPEPPPFRLISVWGEGSDLNADVVTNGIRVSLKAGDTAMGGWKVLAIAGDEMKVQKGRRIETVKLGG